MLDIVYIIISFSMCLFYIKMLFKIFEILNK